jgi:hypothetical protein
VGETDSKSRDYLLWFPTLTSIALAAYVLSTGPVIKFASRASGRPSNTVMAAYYPLIMLSQNSKTADKFLNWYIMDFWHAR